MRGHEEPDPLFCFTYTFNWDNKLRKAEWPTGNSIEIKYDPLGNRVYKKSGSNESKYVVDITGELPTILLDIDKSTGSLKKSYIYADRQIIAQHDGDSSDDKYFYLHDRLGSVRLVINDSGNVVKYYTYEPFGELIEDAGTFDNAFRFTGQYFDSEIEEYYLWARQYNPQIARFTSRDPILGDQEEPLTLHKYLYCANDPINNIDPTGKNLWGQVEAVTAGYSVHYGAIGYAAYGVSSGIDAFLSLGIQMEKMILPVMAIAMAKTQFPRDDGRFYKEFERPFLDGVGSNYSGSPQGSGWNNLSKYGKWITIGTGLAIITYKYRNEIKELFTPEPWNELFGNVKDDDTAISAPGTQ